MLITINTRDDIADIIKQLDLACAKAAAAISVNDTPAMRREYQRVGTIADAISARKSEWDREG